MNTIITEDTENGENSYDILGKLSNDRIIFITEYLDDKQAMNIAATLLFLDSKNDSQKISIYLNLQGGDLRAVFMIYDVIKTIKSPVETICIGVAKDEGALILAAGTKGMRYSTKSSTICLSHITPYDLNHGDFTEVTALMLETNKDNKIFMSSLAKCVGKTAAVLTKDCERKLYLTPAQAKKYGVIDAIIGEK